jgi:ankyrin repeat protein
LVNIPGIQIDQPDYAGHAALHSAALRDQLESATVIVAHGCDVNLALPGCETPLMTAVICSGESMVESLLSLHQIEVDCRDYAGRGLLHLAVQQRNLKILECLIGQSCNLELEDNLRMTAIHCAAAYGWLDGCKALYAAGALLNGRGMKLSEVAAERKQWKMAEKNQIGDVAQYDEVIQFLKSVEES